MPIQGASWMRRYALWLFWLLLVALSAFLYTRGIDLAKAAGCFIGETCVSGAGIEATMYVGAAVLMWLVLAPALVVLIAWKAWKVVFRRPRNKPHGESH